MNIKLVKLTAEYKKQLTDMMDEWLAVEKDFSPYAIRKNDYHDFEYYLENLETKEGENFGLVLVPSLLDLADSLVDPAQKGGC